MRDLESEYAPRNSVSLYENARLLYPDVKQEHVQLTDSATVVFTDFHKVTPVTASPETSVDAVLDKMKQNGVRLLLVVSVEEQVMGIVTTTDVLGDKPIRVAKETGVEHTKILVSDVMTPHRSITALEMDYLRDACVGHIVATFHQLERRHLLVVDTNERGQHDVRGLFSATQISKQLGYDIVDQVVPAHSLAEMVQRIGK